ncbi:MAG: hypothetical protein QXG32_01290 [Candidatus Bathyarchaeia archaeon]
MRFKSHNSSALMLALLAVGWIGWAAAADWAPSGQSAKQVVGTKSALVALVKFLDVPSSLEPAHFRGLVFSDLNRYLMEISYGKVSIAGDVTDRWFPLPKPLSSYTDPNVNRGIRQLRFLEDAVKTIDSHVNFSKYEFLIIVYSGKNFLISGDPRDMESFSSRGPYRIDTGEGRISVGVTVVAEHDPLGSFAHGILRNFGLENLYIWRNREIIDPVEEWDPMAHGYWAGNGSSPVHPCAWNKLKLGWIGQGDVASVEDGGVSTFDLAPLGNGTGSPKAIRINISKDLALFMEYRVKAGFDSGLPSEGLLLYYVREGLEEGYGPMRIIDSRPGTPTLNDAPFSPGEIFQNSSLGITVFILKSPASGCTVKVDRTGLPPLVRLRVSANVANATMEVDGKPVRLEGHSSSLILPIGDHVLKAEPIIQSGSIRAIFASWNGSLSENPLSIALKSDALLIATYRMQYPLRIRSAFGEVSGDGWYDEGARAIIRAIKARELANGTRIVFAGWGGAISSTDPEVGITIDSPKEVTANWRRQYSVKIGFRGLPNGSRAGLWVNGGEVWTKVPEKASLWLDAGEEVSLAINKTIAADGSKFELVRVEDPKGKLVEFPIKLDGPREFIVVYRKAPTLGIEGGGPDFGKLMEGLLRELIEALRRLLEKGIGKAFGS